MFNSNWVSLKPEISMYEVIRNSKQENEFNLEGLMYPNGNCKDDMCSSDDGNMALSKDSFRDTSSNFKQFMDNVRQLDAALTANAEKNDAYYTNLHIKYRRTLSVQDIEAMFSVLLASHKISKKSKRNWTDEEILLLIYFVRFYCLGHELTPITMTEDDWWVIAKLLPRRAADVTKDKWMSLHHIHIHDAPWTTEEDNQLMTLIQRFGLKKWTAIARELNKFSKNSLVFRQGKQCRERWINHLDPSINKGSWTSEEDIKLLKAVTELGKKWSEIAKLISNRTENAVKNRWKSLIKKHRFELSSVAASNPSSAAFERLITQIVLQMRVKDSNSETPANAMTTQGTTTTHPVSEMESPIHEDDQVDWLLDNIDEEIEVKTIPDSVAKKNEQVPSLKDKSLAESSNIKLLNSLFAGDNNCGSRPVSTTPVGISSNTAFPELRMDRGGSAMSENTSASPKKPNKNVEFRSINELDDMKELENLEVCLYNGSKKVVYKASDLVQKKVLHNFIMSMISLEDAKRDTFASLLNNTSSVAEPEVKVEPKATTPKSTAMTNEVKNGMTFQQLINSSRSSNIEAGRLFNMSGSNGMNASNGMMLASNGMMRASNALLQSNGMMNESLKSSRGGSDVFHGFAHRAPSEFFNFEEEFYDKAKGNLLNSALSNFLDNEESPFFRNIKESVTPYFK